MDATELETLEEAGLTWNEAKVYISLLKLNSATAVEITNESKVHRVNVYDALERLREKGLISTIYRGKKRIFEAADPKQLLQLVKQKEERINQALPRLTQEFRMRTTRQQVHHFLGPEGVMQAYFMTLKEEGPVYALGGSGLNRQYLKHRHEMWNKERLKLKKPIKALYYEFTRKEKEKGWNDPTVEIRYLPDEFRTIGMVDICGSLVINLVPTEGSIMAIVIEQKELADTYKRFFEFIWRHARA